MIISSPARVRYKNQWPIEFPGKKHYNTFIASSASGLQFTHHCGLMIGSMISPDLLPNMSKISPYMVIHKPANRKLHWVLFRLHVEACDGERLHHCFPGMKPFHPLIERSFLIDTPYDLLTRNFSPALAFKVPSSLRMLINSNLCRRPTS